MPGELVLIVPIAVYIVYLHLALAARRRELHELQKAMIVIPLPKKSGNAWLRLLTFTVIVLSVAVLYLALR